MPLNNNIEITNDDIVYAENILLWNWEHFDTERKDFIKNLDTIDLQAVPWSGKTTALLAKLIILERKMPFSNWTGILVLSHTNTAVDEINDRLWKIAPKLFQFPNFIWTIQSFVDEFLTKPYGVSFLWINFNHIDVDYYESKIVKKFNAIYWSTKYDKPWGLFYWRQITNAKKLSKWNTRLEKEICNTLVKNEIKKLFFDFNDEKIKLFTDYSVILSDKENLKYIWLKSMILEVISEWIISYDYAYNLGFKYLEKFPKIIKILQKRFQFVFVDEMQDMEKHQIDILENIFYKKHVFKHSFQRIGDRNQAIYNWWDIKIDSEWRWWPRKELQIVWTHRLTESVANVVKNFWVDFIPFDWKRVLEKNDKSALLDIKPIMLVYNTEHLNNENPEYNENHILKSFTKIINSKKTEWYFEDVKDDKFICKAVIWNAKPQDWLFNQSQCRAKHYFFDYDLEWWKSKNKSWLKTKKDYLYYYDITDNSYKSKNSNIWRLLLRILRDNDIKNPNTWKIFSRKEQLFEYIEKKDDSIYKEKSFELKSKIYDWTKRLNDTTIDEIAQEMDNYYFDDLLPNIFWEKLRKSIFLSEKSSNVNIIKDNKEMNLFIDDSNWLKINIWTVHSVKWETHTCTLYLESSSHSKYESDLCFFLWWIEEEINRKQQAIQFLKDEIISLAWWRGTKSKQDKIKSFESQISNIKSSWKMLYVWLSRPTHLLCYAIHEDRYNNLIAWEWNEAKVNELWDIEKIN